MTKKTKKSPSKKKTSKKKVIKKKKVAAKKVPKKASKKTSKKKKATKPTKPVKTFIIKKKATKSTKSTKPAKTFITLILDRSFSMHSIQQETIEHFNEQIEEIQTKSTDGMDTRVSLVTFSGNDSIKLEFFNKPLEQLKPLTLRSYKPDGGTAMYDAVGMILNKMATEIEGINDKDAASLVIIFSDGAENDSKRFSRQDIAKKIQVLQNTDRWTFSYLGANQDLKQIEDDLYIPAGNIMNFAATSDGTRTATTQSVNSVGNYMTSRTLGVTKSSCYYK